MLWVLRTALRLVDRWTRRRIALSAVISLVMAIMEAAAFALIYAVLSILSDPTLNPVTKYPLLKHVVSSKDRSGAIRALALIGISLFLLKSVSAAVAARWQARVQSQTEARLATKLFATYVEQDYLAHLSRNSSILIRNLTASIGTMCTSVLGAFTVAVTDGAILLGIFVTLVVVSPGVSAGVLLYLAVIISGYLIVITPSIQKASSRDQYLTGRTLQLMQESFAGIKTVKAFDVSHEAVAVYRRQREQLAQSRGVLSFVQRLPQYYLEICLVLGIGIAALLTAETAKSQSRAAFLGLFVGAALRALPSVNRLLNAANSIRGGRPAIENLVREGGQGYAPIERTPERELAQLTQTLKLDSIGFSYQPESGPVLTDIRLTIPQGRSLGIVGPSGAGKSTLVDLLLGLLTPTIGAIVVDDVALDVTLLSSWRRQIGYVPQETYLLDASVRDNVTFFRLGCDDAQVWSALSTAQLADFIRALPDGLDTPVGEAGSRLSGGQRQRLGIARALLVEPSVLILDEATSALDGATEAAIMQTLTRLRGAVTTITIAHRLSTVRSCDEILILDGGRIVGRGRFEDLLATSPVFADMVRLGNVLG